MKAKVIRKPYCLANLNIGDIVEIIPGMETDADSIWNVPAGKLVLCKKEDGTFTYASLLDMEIVDYYSIDWEAFRREAAKEILANMLSCPTTMNLGEKAIKTVGDYVSFAIGLTDELIKQLKK